MAQRANHEPPYPLIILYSVAACFIHLMLTRAIYVEFEKMISVSKRLYATKKQGEGICAPRQFGQNIPPIRLELYITIHVIKEMLFLS